MGGAAAGPLAPRSGLIQPLVASAAAAAGGGGGSGGSPAEEVILDSEEEQQEQQPPATGAAAPAGATLEGLAAAVAVATAKAVVSGSAGEQGQAAAGLAPVVAVCQRACAHLLRLLAAPGVATLQQLLGALLCSLVQQCRQQLGLKASASRRAHHHHQQQQQPLLLGFRDPQAAEAVQQSLAALARGLLLELLPLRLGSDAQLELQRRRLTAGAVAVSGGLADAGLSSAALQRRLAAALAD